MGIGHNGQMTQVWRSLADVPANLGPAVVTIGNFDGVHRGHQAVLRRMVANAHARGLASVALTFHPHPKAVHTPEHTPELITGIEDRLEQMAATGLDGILLQEYTLDFAQQTPLQFVTTYLVHGLHAATVVVGRDTRFGRGNAGDLTTMRELGEQLGFTVEVIADASGTDATRRWSSTWVRELLEDGDLVAAAEVLGRPHRLRGTVEPGDQLGRTIGFPTANIAVSGGFIPRHGVYAGWLTVVDPGPDTDPALVGVRLPAAVSLGLNYTVGGTDLRVEAHVIDATGINLYGAAVTLDLVRWRRPMLDFGGLDPLVAALHEDVQWCRDQLGLPASQQ